MNSQTNPINTKAVKALLDVGDKIQSYDQSIKECEKILKKAFSEAEKEIGRPMTYAEMRARFG
jgi:hypothetical protein